MGLFSGSPAKEFLVQAQTAFDNDDPKEALKFLRQGFSADPAHKPLYKMAGDCLKALGSPEESELFQTALENFRDPEPFFKLGVHFNRHNFFELSPPFLQRALKLDQDHLKAALELSVALSSRFRINEAVEVLENMNFTDSFWTVFQMQYLLLLKGETAGIHEFIEAAREQLQAEKKDEFCGPLSYLVVLEEMLGRFEAVGNPGKNIRDWHFIQYGTGILHYFSDPEEYVAGGRFVATWSYPQTVRNVLEKLKWYLALGGRKILIVAAAPGRDSEIIGRAAATVLGVPFSTAGHNRPGTLVVAADNRALNCLDCLEWTKNNQVVFALNLNWLEGQRYVPDVCGWMSQSTYHYWDGGGLTFDSVTQKMKRSEPDTRSAEEIAADIAAYTPETDPDDQETYLFYERHAELMRGGEHDSGYRGHFTPVSPVEGAFFH